ncbi:MAG TPA: potassium channel family protein, partial [Candidatus Eisenbacteria bacterium]
MNAIAGIAGAALLLVVLWDAFETVVLPRRVSGRMRLTRTFYRATWKPFRAGARWARPGARREAYLSFFGPLSLVFLIATWAVALVFAFGLLQYANGSSVRVGAEAPGLATDLYLSGTTFFTLGLGDALPHGTVARVLAVVESGVGFGFLAVVVGYFPVLYQAFSRREYGISLLDARAGSPPSAAELLRRHAGPGGREALEDLLYEWERWAAELLETHLSYPLLAYYRSQHTNQSWLAALTAILDTCALTAVGVEGACAGQARLTFAMTRHAVVDLAQVFGAPPRTAPENRLPPEAYTRLRAALAAAGLPLPEGAATEAKLAELRRLYEPYVTALSQYLLQPLPPWQHESPR